MRPVSRNVAALTTASLLVASLSACGEQRPAPDATAEALVAALTTGDFSSVPLNGTDAAAAGDAVVQAFEPLAGLERTHQLLGVDVPEETDAAEEPAATARIETTWDVPATEDDFTYTTTAELTYDAEAERWEALFGPEVLAPGLTAGGYLADSRTPAARGDILGEGGQTLVTERDVLNIGIDKANLSTEAQPAAARELAELVGIDADAYVDQVAAAGQSAWVQAITLRANDRDVTDAQLAAIDGVLVQQGTLPLAPTREFARPVLGTVGPATAEIVEASEGRIAAGDVTGRSGLQARYDEQLAGTAGLSIARYTEDGEKAEELFATAPQDGADVQTTLDADLQTAAETVLNGAAELEDVPSALVAIRPSDSAVLAAASGPGSGGYNTALLGQYAPGSTFKVVSALAMLRGGATADSSFECTETTTVNGKTFKNFDAYPSAALGPIPLSEALAQSCNTVFVNAGADVGAAAVADAAAALGLTGEDTTGTGAFRGSVPADSEGTELAANMIGQGVVLASPLGMATVAASVAAGQTVQPALVLDAADSDDEADASGAAAESGTADASPTAEADAAPSSSTLAAEEAEALAQMMGGVVDHGTLTLLQDVPGEPVIGKSGTAEYDDEQNAHAWTIAIQGDLAVAAFVETGDGGSRTAGPLVRDFLTAVQAETDQN
ncbi:penicillin-binding transpeptidase domain-containing protein [Zhihengliuella flava]|uniref:Beta-lactamase n=1 Tax=Zhihengliuella flava TaxID=1285193 RepID=A0A931D9D8_9MICC|nr:penicillin-binding transpeptidase domain-containing protein [Zhihengliuella flava]MBG6084418.1 cell division protein FtsI/penicillin-binding protein 2 [Zhihengliuella flava]